MTKIVEGEKYLNTQEVRDTFDKASKKRFYDNIKPYLRVHRFDAKKTPWYKESDVAALKVGKPVRKANIGISGILGNWTTFLRSLGYSAETIDRSVEIVTLPDDAVSTFRLPADKQFVKRSRMTFADGTPICTWDTYYPRELINDDLLEEMKQGVAHDIVSRIKNTHGVTVGIAKDKYTARLTTFEEQNLFQLLADEAVLILQRVSYTKDRKILVLYQDMVLLGNWFAPEHEYNVSVWENK